MNRHERKDILRTRPHGNAALRRLSKKGRRVDALALRADERRDKLRKAAVRSKYPVTRRCLNGETRQSEPLSSVTEYIGCGREPAELKHLSRRRKRKKIDSVSRGDRKRKSPNRCACTTGFGLSDARGKLAERHWKDLGERVIPPYAKADRSRQYPE